MSLIGARLAIDTDVNGAGKGARALAYTKMGKGIGTGMEQLHMPEKLIFCGGVIKPPGLEDDAGITGAIALGRRALERK